MEKLEKYGNCEKFVENCGNQFLSTILVKNLTLHVQIRTHAYAHAREPFQETRFWVSEISISEKKKNLLFLSATRGRKASTMKTTRSIIARYYTKDDTTYAIVYTLKADKSGIESENLKVPEGIRLGGYIKSASVVNITSDNGAIVSIRSDAEEMIFRRLLADAEPKPAEDAEQVSLADLLGTEQK